MDQKVKLIIIDLYGVMTQGNYWNTCRYLSKKYKLDVNHLYDIVYHEYFHAACLGKTSERSAFQGMIKDLQLKETYDGLRKKHMSFQKINKSVFNLSLKLKSDYKILLLSKNVPSQFNEIVKHYNLNKYFDIINTFSLKLDKKDPGVIRHVLKKYKLKPGEVIMIDDQEFNLTAPKKIGVRVIHYKNFIDFKKQLYGIIK